MIGRSGVGSITVHDRLADLEGELGLGPGEALRRVLVADLGARDRVLELLAEPGRVDRDLDDARPVEPEHHPALELGGRVVEVDDRPGRPGKDSKVRSMSSSRHWTSTWIVTSSGIRSSSMIWRRKSKSVWEADGNPTSISLKPTSTSVLEQGQLALGVHRVDEGLVAVAQVHAAQRGRGRQLAVGPRPVGQDEREVRPVEVEGHGGRIARQWRSARSPVAGRAHLVSSSVLGRFAGCLGHNKKPPGHSAQEVASERDVAFAVR